MVTVWFPWEPYLNGVSDVPVAFEHGAEQEVFQASAGSFV